MENMTQKSVQRFRSDNAPELLSKDFKSYLSEKGIVMELSPPYSPESNGRAERVQQTILGITRCLLATIRKMPSYLRLWDEAVLTANFIRNRTFSESTQDANKTPYEAFTGNRPDLSSLRVFGCRAFVHIPKQKRTEKLQSRSEAGILVGYNFDGCYRVLVTQNDSMSIQVSKDVDFDESILGVLPDISNHSSDVLNLPAEGEDEDMLPTSGNDQTESREERQECEAEDNEPTIPENHQPVTDNTADDSGDQEAVTYVPGARRSSRVTKQPERFSAMLIQQCLLSNAVDPLTVEEALKSADSAEWTKAMNEELEMISRLGTWSPAFLPKGKRAVKTKWVFNRKHNLRKMTVRHRARLCAKGFYQKFGIDFDDVFAPVARYATMRFMVSLKVRKNYVMILIYFKYAFLN